MVSTAVSRPKGGAVSFSIDDGSGPIRVTISPRSGIASGAIKRGAWLELRGVVGQETTAKAPLKGYRLWPRLRTDLVVIAAPVTGATATPPCCAHGAPTAAPQTRGRLPDAQEGEVGAPGPAIPPILARPQPTSPATPAVTVGPEPATEHSAPREAGLVVSGMGLAALAGLAAWFGRRRPLRVELEDAHGERRILPPT
jgi:hypothetical protein